MRTDQMIKHYIVNIMDVVSIFINLMQKSELKCAPCYVACGKVFECSVALLHFPCGFLQNVFPQTSLHTSSRCDFSCAPS